MQEMNGQYFPQTSTATYSNIVGDEITPYRPPVFEGGSDDGDVSQKDIIEMELRASDMDGDSIRGERRPNACECKEVRR